MKGKKGEEQISKREVKRGSFEGRMSEELKSTKLHHFNCQFYANQSKPSDADVAKLRFI